MKGLYYLYILSYELKSKNKKVEFSSLHVKLYLACFLTIKIGNMFVESSQLNEFNYNEFDTRKKHIFNRLVESKINKKAIINRLNFPSSFSDVSLYLHCFLIVQYGVFTQSNSRIHLIITNLIQVTTYRLVTHKNQTNFSNIFYLSVHHFRLALCNGKFSV